MFSRGTLKIIFMFFLGVSVSAEGIYYRSNSIGMVFEEIGGYQLNDFNWIIEIEKNGNLETRRLYLNRKEVKRTEYSRDQNSLITEEYDPEGLNKRIIKENGRVSSEEYYNDGIKEKYFYTWSDSGIKSIIFEADDVLIYRDEFLQDGNGRLKQIRRIYEKSMESGGYDYGESGIKREWYNEGGELLVYRYKDGSLSSSQKYLSGELISEESLDSVESGNIRTEKDYQTGEVKTSYYNSNGDIIRELIDRNGRVVRTEYFYKDDILTEKVIASPGVRERHLYKYDTEGETVLEEVFRNGVLMMDIVFDNGEKSMERIYRNTEIALIVYFENGEKVREERQ